MEGAMQTKTKGQVGHRDAWTSSWIAGAGQCGTEQCWAVQGVGLCGDQAAWGLSSGK